MGIKMGKLEMKMGIEMRMKMEVKGWWGGKK